MEKVVTTKSHVKIKLDARSAAKHMFIEHGLPILDNHQDVLWLQQIPFEINRCGSLEIPVGYEHPKYVRSLRALIFQNLDYKCQHRQYAAPCNVWKRDMIIAPHPAGTHYNSFIGQRKGRSQPR
jgi:hypothetical protein